MHDFLVFPSLSSLSLLPSSLVQSALCFLSLSFLPISFSVVITGDAIKGCNYNGKREILWSEKLINFNQRETENRGRKKEKRYTGKDIQRKRATSLLRESQLDWIWFPLSISLSKRDTLLLCFLQQNCYFNLSNLHSMMMEKREREKEGLWNSSRKPYEEWDTRKQDRIPFINLLFLFSALGRRRQ